MRMAMPPVYRYDVEDFADGQVITSRGDHYSRLTPAQKKVELLIRDRLADGTRIRSQSLYVWKDLDVAVRAWRRTVRNEHLYELAIDVEDIEHVGDVSLYSSAVDAREGELAVDAFVREYCDRKTDIPRIEILVRKATVTKRLYHDSEK
jgi:hypothetical protein